MPFNWSEATLSCNDILGWQMFPMLKHVALALSLLLNCVLIFLFVVPSKPDGMRMTCKQAQSEVLNKQATVDFALKNNGSFVATHDFLQASDYRLRNIANIDDKVTFIYVAKSYPQTCGFHLPVIDGTIVRVQTDSSVLPSVTGVN